MHSDVFSTDWRTKKPSYDLRHKEIMAKARREIDLADHLVYVTMPLTDDTKFMLAIIEHVFNASSSAIESVLEQMRYYKKLEAFPRTFGAMTDIWVRDVQDKHNFERKYAEFLKKVGEMRHAISTSSMRFKRQDKYILTNDVYSLKVLDIDTVKKYLSIAKDFVDKSEDIIKEEDARQSVLKDNE
ncbi:hypothetical protein HN924_03620 [Candidatus Woesearchaeota archaeon]|jgi:hypothetical protein|nr:hypothetical protein [Candidatus Woesearchaeota archaeon]MBT7063029.1 hypothetical protein [Candidatus Woesearchaeota archaeon]MBT7402496.1 hypothetical protein [Candidatus Woesearchaeota archaeon]